MHVLKLTLLLFLVLFIMMGCVLTKVVTVPMRVVGAATSIVPVVGSTTHKAIDKAADVVDKAPL